MLVLKYLSLQIVERILEEFIVKNKTKIFLIGVAVTTVILVFFYFFNQNRAIVAAPDAFFFSVEGTSGDYEVYYAEEAISSDDYNFKNVSWDSDAVHLYVDSKYLDNEWNYAYISGNYWYSPTKPKITVNGQEITSVKAEGGNSKKTYHFYLYEIKENQQYTISVRCGEDRKRIKVVFHSK